MLRARRSAAKHGCKPRQAEAITVHILCAAPPSPPSMSRSHILHARLAHTSTNRRVAMAAGKARRGLRARVAEERLRFLLRLATAYVPPWRTSTLLGASDGGDIINIEVERLGEVPCSRIVLLCIVTPPPRSRFILPLEGPSSCCTPDVSKLAAATHCAHVIGGHAMAEPGTSTVEVPAPQTDEHGPGVTDQAAPADSTAPAVMRKAGRNRGNIRKRPAADEAADSVADGAGGDEGSVMRPPKAPKAGGFAFTTRQTNDDQMRPFKFASSRTVQQTTDQGATATLETETQFDRDARFVIVYSTSDITRACSSCVAMLRRASRRHGYRFAERPLLVAGRCGRRYWPKPTRTQRRPVHQTARTRASITTPTIRRYASRVIPVAASGWRISTDSRPAKLLISPNAAPMSLHP